VRQVGVTKAPAVDEDPRRIGRQARLAGAVGQVLEHVIAVAVAVAELAALEAQAVVHRHHVDPGDRLRDARGDQQAQRAVDARRTIERDVPRAGRQPNRMLASDEPLRFTLARSHVIFGRAPARMRRTRRSIR
jgi:hypothetical protein